MEGKFGSEFCCLTLEIDSVGDSLIYEWQRGVIVDY